MNRATQQVLKENFKVEVQWQASTLKTRENFLDLLTAAITDLASGIESHVVLATLLGAYNAVKLIDLAEDIHSFNGFTDDENPI